jgi:universal stress protein A
MLKPTKILVPTDFSENSDRALVQGLDIAGQYKAKLVLLHVIHEDIYRAGLEFAFLEESARHETRERATSWAEQSLRDQLGKFSQSKDVEMATRVRWGIPYDEILKEATEQGIDLIVIASLGRSGIAKYFMGSVARNVLKGAKCPVLLTK